MKAFLMALIAGLSITASTADKPNFSGEWKMDAARSHFGTAPPPDSVIRKITHTEPTITIVEEQTANGAPWNSTRTVKTDGLPVTFDINSSAVTTAMHWENADLIADTTIDSKINSGVDSAVKFHDRMSLSEDGKVLTSKVLFTSYQGSVELLVVFDRQ